MATNNSLNVSLAGATGTGNFVGSASPVFTSDIKVTTTVAIGLGASSISTNTGLGVTALNAITTGARNVAVGNQAAKLLTSGADNVAVGSSSLAAATTGNYNTCAGPSTGLKLTTGSNNTAIGSGLTNATATNDNTAFGVNAVTGASAGTTTNNNVGLGNASISSGTKIRCVGIGRNTISAALSVTGLVAIGYNALTNNGVISYNLAAGVQAGGSITNGYNTIVGFYAGYTGATGGVALTNSSYNTCVGLQASADTVDTTGVIAIGANAVGTKATGTTNITNGPGIAIGSATYKVGFRGDGTIYPTAGASQGYWRVYINGVFYKIQLFADA